MPEILRMFGMRFYFYSREHEPIHVHVKNADGRAKFEITDDAVVLVYNKARTATALFHRLSRRKYGHRQTKFF